MPGQHRFAGHCSVCGLWRMTRGMTLWNGDTRRVCSDCERRFKRRLSRQTRRQFSWKTR